MPAAPSHTPFADLRTKAINAREHGALGLIVVHGPRYHADEPVRAPARDGEGYMSSGLLAAFVSQQAADALLAGTGTTLAALQRSIDVLGWKATVVLLEPSESDKRKGGAGGA